MTKICRFTACILSWIMDHIFILHPGIVPGGDLAKARGADVFRAFFVHSNINAKSAPKAGTDPIMPERQVAAKPGVWFKSKLKPYFEALVRKFERAGDAEMENYLAASQNLADLEDRIRRYERMQSRWY